MKTKLEYQVGDVVVVRGVRCRIEVIRPAGTIDVVSEDGKRAWRVSGLWGSIAQAATAIPAGEVKGLVIEVKARQ